MDSPQKVLRFPEGGPEGSREAPESTPSNKGVPPAQEPTSDAPPVWMQRFFLITTVIFCFWVGLLLTVLPWSDRWNSFVGNLPYLQSFFDSSFVRGVVTGLGIVDLWIGIAEAVHYREKQ
ncbi:MAG TPA: hypothetical protein VFQ00_06675 [Terriglobales bacterium]|nr:hypothetical protein [Terriglobales bacterium]